MASLDEREEKLQARAEALDAWEEEIRKREKSMKEKEKAKKQVLLRLAPGLWDEIAAWAEEDFRSINGQIEYLLSESVKRHKNK
jgi:hypothetical protein